MLFNSYVFIFAFLPVTAVGFAVLGNIGHRRAGILWLVLCSMFYYAWWSQYYLALLLISMVVNYLIGAFWLSTPSVSPALRRVGLLLGLAFNLTALAYFKYTNLLIDSINTVTGSAIHVRHIILPLGISFFTFKKIAYLVDVYRGRGYSRNFLDYALFVMFFPQLIAGPIVHPREILPQFSRRSAFGITAKNLSVGLTMFVFGLCKKVLIADSIAPTVSRVFGAAAAGTIPQFSASWLAVLSYSLQIYFDFSGYTDMAIGLARIFGVRLPLNFNSPYKADSISDFWRRWHMTLSRFLRDYLYIPLGGNRKGPLRRYLNLMITMLLGGLWHGASWTFMFWGGLHGLYLCINHAWTALVNSRRDDGQLTHSLAGTIAARGVTFLAVVVAWVFFRAESFPAAARILKGMSGISCGIDAVGFWETRNKWLIVVALLAFVFVAPNTQQIMAAARPALGVLPPRRKLDRSAPDLPWLWEPSAAWALAAAAFIIVGVLFVSRASEFIYYQF
jgi:alginate O-acetyltransferase complex protein AlgI